jgi:hypothetical protein
MKKGCLYSLLFGIPGSLIAALLAAVIFWILIDTTWLLGINGDVGAAFSEEAMLSVPVIIFVILWAFLIISGYVVGKNLGNDSPVNWKHILISAGLTLLIFTPLVWWGVSNLNYEADAERCDQFCVQSGYNVSIPSPIDEAERTCYCSNSYTGDKIIVPLDSIDPDISK